MPTPPSNGPVTSAYGPRKLQVPGVGPFHYGEDRIGEGNVAPEGGVIVFALYSGVFGNIIGVRAGDVVWNIAHHAHLNGRARGQRVAEGEYLAPLGSTGLATGPHSHTERRVAGRDAIQSGIHTDPARHYTQPRPAAGTNARPLEGFLMALTDKQQQEMYDNICGGQQRELARVFADELLERPVRQQGRFAKSGPTKLRDFLAWAGENVEGSRDLVRAMSGVDVGDIDVDKLADLLSKNLGAVVAADLARRLQA